MKLSIEEEIYLLHQYSEATVDCVKKSSMKSGLKSTGQLKDAMLGLRKLRRIAKLEFKLQDGISLESCEHPEPNGLNKVFKCKSSALEKVIIYGRKHTN